jgi:formiminoglutamase
MDYFRIAAGDYLGSLLSKRPGEVKLGERVLVLKGSDLKAGLETSRARFVLLGIAEDIGVRANGGVGGAGTLWEPALKAILNVQETEVCTGASLLLLGAFDFSSLMREADGRDPAALREIVPVIDDAVFPVIRDIVASGKTPVVIGGGHNNAYPLLKGASMALGKPLHCINLDAHADYRAAEGRHSGNGFRYARQEGYLDRYAVAGLHRSYNSQAMLQMFETEEYLHHSFYEDIFLKEQMTFRDAVNAALHHTANGPAGIELDMDCIEGVLSSAATPCGITPLQARQYLHWCLGSANVAYIHITEGAVALSDGRKDGSVAKLTAYLVSDLLRDTGGFQEG